MPETDIPPPSRVLVLEDEPLILIGVESALADAGYVVRSTPTCAGALALLDEEVFDTAILDVGLPDGDCSAVAAALVSRNIPFVFCTGSDAVPEGFEGVPVVEKPYLDGALLGVLRSVVAMR